MTKEDCEIEIDGEVVIISGHMRTETLIYFLQRYYHQGYKELRIGNRDVYDDSIILNKEST